MIDCEIGLSHSGGQVRLNRLDTGISNIKRNCRIIIT